MVNVGYSPTFVGQVRVCVFSFGFTYMYTYIPPIFVGQVRASFFYFYVYISYHIYIGFGLGRLDNGVCVLFFWGFGLPARFDGGACKCFLFCTLVFCSSPKA